MRKSWMILLCLLALACVFCACDENNTPNEDNTPPATCQHRDVDDNSLCDTCGESYTDGVDVPPEHTHAWGDWNVIVAATCTTDGSRFRVCSTCQYNQIEVVPAAHTYDAENTCEKCSHYKDEGVVFTLRGDTYEVTYYTGNATEVIIPSKYSGVAVTAVGTSAFRDCNGLTSITIGNAVTSIDSSAFLGCSGLESSVVASGNTKYHSAGNCVIETESQTLVLGCKNSVIPTDGSVTSIGYNAFRDCSGLTSITIPNSVTSIGSYAFYDCSGLTSITIPNSVTSIGANAFRYCNGLESITVASGNTKYHSASNCLIETASKTLILGCKNSVIPTDGSVTSIGDGAFYYCSKLTSITIPNSVTSIGDDAFEDCSGLTSITIPNSVTSIGSSAFRGCSGLESITVASGNTKYHSAGNCLIRTASKTLVLGCKNSAIPTDGTVTSIGDYAFYDCDDLTSITIPNSVTSIGDHAFYDCSKLTSIKYRGTEAQWNAIYKGSAWDAGTGNYTITYNYTGK